MRIFGKGFNFSQDGPGNRLVYHLSGCNMHCIWCSNPEGMDRGAGKDCTAREIVDEALRCRPMFFGGGGVTFTGGEATLWHDELLETLRMLRENAIHTAIETNGTDERLSELLPYVDYLIMDFKHHDSDTLRRFTGRGNEAVKRNYEYVCALGRQLHVRIPLINGFNADTPEQFAAYLCGADATNVVFEFLPYHEYGKEKWKSEYLVKDGFVTKAAVAHFRDAFQKHGLKTITT